MPRRFIVDEIRTSTTRARMSAEATVLWDNLITLADDYGLFEADPEIVARIAFPRRPSWMPEQGQAAYVDKLLRELASVGDDGDPPAIELYVIERKRYGRFLGGWQKAQGTPRAKRPRYPVPASGAVCVQMRADECMCAQMPSNVLASAFASASASASAEESAPDDPAAPVPPTPPSSPLRPRFIPPTVEQVAEHCREKGYTFDPQAFVAYYASNGWRVGRSPMKSWQAACVTWQSRETRRPGNGRGHRGPDEPPEIPTPWRPADLEAHGGTEEWERYLDAHLGRGLATWPSYDDWRSTCT